MDNEDFLSFMADDYGGFSYNRTPPVSAGMASNDPRAVAFPTTYPNTRSATNTSTFDRRTSPLKPDGSLNKIPFKYSDHTYYLPPKPHSNTDQETKALVFDDIVQEIRGSQHKWLEKCNVLSQHYNNHVVFKSVKAFLYGRRDPSSDYHSWEYRRLLNSGFDAVAMAAGAANVPAEARYAVFDLVLAVPPVDRALVSVENTTIVNVCVKLLMDEANPAIIDSSYTPAIVRDFRQLVQTDTRAPGPGGMAMVPPRPARLYQFGMHRNNEDPFSIKEYKNLVDQYFYECAFRLLVADLRRAVVGHGAVQTVDHRLQVLKQTSKDGGRDKKMTVQAYFDRFMVILNEKDGNLPYGNVTATFYHNLNEKIKTHLTNLGILPPSTPAPSNTHEVNAIIQLKEHAIRAESALKSNFDQAVAVMHGRRGTAGALVAYPSQQANVPMFIAPGTSDTAGNAGTAYAGTQPSFEYPQVAPATYGYAAPAAAYSGTSSYGTGAYDQPMLGTDSSMSPYETMLQHNPLGVAQQHSSYPTQQAYIHPQPGVATNPSPNVQDMALAKVFLGSVMVAQVDEEDGGSYIDDYFKAVDIAAQAQAFVSTAEQAMRNASGTNKPMECWGCTNDPRFHNSRFHRFATCPNKTDPEVRARANGVMKRLFGDRGNFKNRNIGATKSSALLSENSVGLSPKEIKENWQNLGFSSKHTAQAVALLVSRDTKNRLRKRYHVQETSNDATTPAHAFMTVPYVDDDVEFNVNGPANALVHVPVLSASTGNMSAVQVTNRLPHVHMPFGVQGMVISIKAATDSCAGLNVGELEYHQAIIRLFPQIVVAFNDLTMSDSQIGVGGVDYSSTGLVCTHEVVYRMPVVLNGQQVTCAIGLSANASASLLIGVPFLVKTRSIMSFTNAQEPVLLIQSLNLSLPITLEAPSRRDPPEKKDISNAYPVIGGRASLGIERATKTPRVYKISASPGDTNDSDEVMLDLDYDGDTPNRVPESAKKDDEDFVLLSNAE